MLSRTARGSSGTGRAARSARLLGVAIAALLVGACASTSLEERRRGDEARCRSYGFRPGSDAFAKCLLDVDLDRAADRRAVQFDRPYYYGYRGAYWRGRHWW